MVDALDNDTTTAPTPDPVADWTDKLALPTLEQQNGLPAGLLTSVMRHESNGDPNARSGTGAQGLFQFEPATAKQYGIDPTDPQQAAQGAAKMYGELYKKYNGDLPSTLAAYNWGQGNVDRKGLENAPKETRDYISRITGDMQDANYKSPDVASQQPTQQQPSSGGGFNPLGWLVGDASAEENTNTPSIPDGFVLDEPQTQNSSAIPDGFVLDSGTLQYTTDPVRTAYQGVMNNVAKPINSTVNAVISPAIGALSTVASKPAQATANAIDNTGIGQWIGDRLLDTKNAVADAGDNIKDLEQYNPDLKNDLSAFNENAQLAGNLPLLKPVAGAAGNLISKTGDAVATAGEAQAAKLKSRFVQDLITPKETPSVASDQFSRSTEQGLLRNRVVQPTPQEQSVIDTVSQLPVSSRNSLLKNYNVIDNALGKEATNLSNNLKSITTPVPDATILQKLEDVRQNLYKNPYIVGDGKVAADSVINNAFDIIAKNPRTPSGLLQSRQELDKLIRSQRGAKTFDPNLDGPISNAVQQVRQTINGMVHDAVPTADVRASLAKQTDYYRAKTNIETKASSEGKNIISRTAQKVANAIPGKSMIAKGAVTLGGASAAAAAPVLTAGALGAYGAGKVLTSPTLKKVLGKTLEFTGNQMKSNGGSVKPKPKIMRPKTQFN